MSRGAERQPQKECNANPSAQAPANQFELRGLFRLMLAGEDIGHVRRQPQFFQSPLRFGSERLDISILHVACDHLSPHAAFVSDKPAAVAEEYVGDLLQ